MAKVGGGRKRKPTHLKVVSGTFRPHRAVDAEPEFDAAVNITAPAWLDYEATRIWDIVAPQLRAQRVLTAVDLHNLEVFAVNYSRWRKAHDDIEINGITVSTADGNIKKNPAVTVANESAKLLGSFGALLGLDPSSRSRINVGKKKSSNNPFDDL